MQVRAGNGLIPKCVKRTQILNKEWSWFFPSSFFHPRLEWTSQLSPLLGVGEVDKLNVKLRSLNVSGLHTFTKKHPICRVQITSRLKISLLPSHVMSVFMSTGCRFGQTEAELQAVLPESVPSDWTSWNAIYRASHHHWVLASGVH